MKATLYGALVLSVSGGILLKLFPKTSRMMPYIRFLLSLGLLVMLLSPLISLLSELEVTDIRTLMPDYTALSGDEGFWSNTVTDAAKARIEASLSSWVCAEFGMEPDDLRISLTTESELREGETAVTVTAVQVSLFRSVHRIAADKIASMIERTMLCPCTVVFTEGEYA